MPNPIISLRNASVVYSSGTQESIGAISDITLDIYPEEFIIFFGPSGCGKSTILYAIAGLERLTAGDVMVAGHNLKQLSADETVEFHRKELGMIFQAYYLIPSLSVRANVALPQIFLGRPKPERIKESEGLLERFGILSQKGKSPAQLSGGQQQRVAISRSLINNPPIVLADEPVGNLDSKSATEVLQLLQELNDRDKKTIILVTHNPNHIGYAHRVFYMQDGKIIREVKNTERTQVREEALKLFHGEGMNEFLLLYPHVDEYNIKIKMLVHYLFKSLDVDIELALERLIRSFFEKTVDRETFIVRLSLSPKENGIGLYHPRAEALADELVSIIGMSEYLHKSLPEFPRSYQKYSVVLNRLRTYFMLFSNTHLHQENIEKLESAIKGRLEGSLTKKTFIAALDLPFDEGGVGLNIRTARNIANMFELILLDYSSKGTFKAVPIIHTSAPPTP